MKELKVHIDHAKVAAEHDEKLRVLIERAVHDGLRRHHKQMTQSHLNTLYRHTRKNHHLFYSALAAEYIWSIKDGTTLTQHFTNESKLEETERQQFADGLMTIFTTVKALRTRSIESPRFVKTLGNYLEHKNRNLDSFEEDLIFLLSKFHVAEGEHKSKKKSKITPPNQWALAVFKGLPKDIRDGAADTAANILADIYLSLLIDSEGETGLTKEIMQGRF